MKVSVAYYSETGNTQELADMLTAALQTEGAEVYETAVSDVDSSEFLDSDLLVFATPATGTEEIDQIEMQAFIDDIASQLSGRKVFLCGTFGWGDGEYMQAWQEAMADLGCQFAHEPFTCLESPDDEAEDKLAEIAKELVRSI
ncbi:flavodoxin domain-containing protein [Amygdalobacter nucleatus]|uniref:flavodoxin domain-containing protein n=1 Tax=Amygdalobacter nucleatus TaxID=3029274 RepID=UPI0027A642BB|nr:flavodoxin domain-containing protein [Amygdalobacter nucleatus]WEG36629.1 flavodoxin domain-containing protein [Amygdalobacter nucleatus]